MECIRCVILSTVQVCGETGKEEKMKSGVNSVQKQRNFSLSSGGIKFFF